MQKSIFLSTYNLHIKKQLRECGGFICNSLDPDEYATQLVKYVVTLQSKFTVTKEVKLDFSRPKWYDKELNQLRKLIKMENNLTVNKSPTTTYNNMCKAKKRKYVNRFIKKDKTRNIWKIVQAHELEIHEMNVEGHLTNNIQSLAQEFAKHFSSKSCQLSCDELSIESNIPIVN